MSRAFKTLAFSLALLAILCYAIADGRPVFGAIMIAAGLAGIWLTESAARRPLPRIVILTLVAIALANAAWAATSGRLTVSAFSEFVTYLQVIKLFDRRRARDFAQLLALAVFQVIGAILTSNSLAVGAIMIVFVPSIALCAALQQVFAASESVPGPWTRHARGAHATRDLIVVAGVCTSGAILGGVTAFLLIPRGLGTQRMGEWGNVSLGQTTSFTDSVTLGVGGLITESQAEVLDLEITNAIGRNLGGHDKIFYLRGAALERYQNGRWAPVQSEPPSRVAMESDRSFPVGGVPSDITHKARITLRNASERTGYLFALWQPARVTFVGNRGTLESGSNGVLRRESPPGRFDYLVESIVDTAVRLRDSDAVRQREVISPRAAELAERVLRDAGIEPDPAVRDRSDDFRAAKELERYLGENYGYTLDILAPRGAEDPIDYFLFNSRQGHCEYFASALTAMCRAVGIRSRVVTGYVAAEFSDGSGRYIVRESNAHAWVEAVVGEGRWTTLDATPPADLTRIHAPSLTPLARLRRFFDAVELAWIDGVVGFDERRRAEVVGVRPMDPRAVENRVADMNIRVSAGGVSLIARAIRNGLVVFVGLSFVLGGAALIARTLYRRFALLRLLRAAQRAEPGLESSLAGASFFADLQALLASRGRGRPIWQGALEHATGVEREIGEPSRLTELVRLYYRARFGRQVLSRDQSAEASHEIADLKKSLRKKRRVHVGGRRPMSPGLGTGHQE